MQVRKILLIAATATMTGVATASAQTAAPVDGTALPPTTSPYDGAAAPAEADAPVQQQTSTQADDGWHLRVGIPIWVPALNGDLTIKGRELSPDQDTGDVYDSFDSHFNGAFALHADAELGRFGLFGDAMYLDLRSERETGAGNAEAVFRGFIGELGAFYTVIASEPDKRGWGAFRVDALAGARITSVEVGINADVGNVSRHQTLFDPIVGARAELGLTNWLSLKARGDVGGFGIQAWDTSDVSYNVDAGLNFHLATWFDVALGYRWLKYDFEMGSDDSSFDASLSGPYVALTFSF
jgi:hypothetical protein